MCDSLTKQKKTKTNKQQKKKQATEPSFERAQMLEISKTLNELLSIRSKNQGSSNNVSSNREYILRHINYYKLK